MDNFNLKQYLFESKLGMYSKGVQDEAGDMMQHTAQEEGMAETGIEEAKANKASTQIEEQPFVILGKEYLVSGDVEVEWSYEAPERDETGYGSGGGYVVEGAKLEKITGLHVGEGDEYRQIQDPTFIKFVQDWINSDKKANTELENVASESITWDDVDDHGYVDEYEPDMDEQIGVGYVMKTKAPEEY